MLAQTVILSALVAVAAAVPLNTKIGTVVPGQGFENKARQLDIGSIIDGATGAATGAAPAAGAAAPAAGAAAPAGGAAADPLSAITGLLGGATGTGTGTSGQTDLLAGIFNKE